MASCFLCVVITIQQTAQRIDALCTWVSAIEQKTVSNMSDDEVESIVSGGEEEEEVTDLSNRYEDLGAARRVLRIKVA